MMKHTTPVSRREAVDSTRKQMGFWFTSTTVIVPVPCNVGRTNKCNFVTALVI